MIHSQTLLAKLEQTKPLASLKPEEQRQVLLYDYNFAGLCRKKRSAERIIETKNQLHDRSEPKIRFQMALLSHQNCARTRIFSLLKLKCNLLFSSKVLGICINQLGFPL